MDQFVTVPKILNLAEDNLEMKDLVVYANLKRHYNKITKDSFPSLDTLAKKVGVTKPTVIKSLKRLEAAGYINIIKSKNNNKYTFSEKKNIEIFSFDFLDDPNLSLQTKALIISMQPHMFKNKQLGIGKITYSELDIARMLNIDLRTLHKYEAPLLVNGDRPIMTLIPTKKVDPETGLPIQERIYDFEAYNNILALKFQQIDDELQDKVSKKDYDMLLREHKELKKQLKELQLKINATEVTPIVL